MGNKNSKLKNLPAFREIADVRFELADNGVQIYYAAKTRNVNYDIAKNKREDYWWVYAHKKQATIVINNRDILCSLPEFAEDLEFWLHATAFYINTGITPWSPKTNLAFKFKLEAQTIHAINPDGFELNLKRLMDTYKAREQTVIRTAIFPDESCLNQQDFDLLLQPKRESGLNLKIDIRGKNFHELVLALQEITRLVEEEYVVGYNPPFTITGEEESDDELEYEGE